MRDRYGRTRFGQSCLLARRLIERGVRFVTVNMFETVFDEVTWDIHGSRPFTDIAQMSREVVPNFDRAYSALLEDLTERGLYSNTIVTAMGEFGRTPKINPAGGRDHHPGVWTIMMGGGPIKGRPHRRRIRRARLSPEVAARQHRRSRCDLVPRAGARPAPRTAGAAESAAAAGGFWGAGD